MPVSPATPVGLNSKTSSHVMVLAGNSTTVLAGTWIVMPSTWIQPPEVLQPSGLGGFELGMQSWSTDAYWINPVISNPAGMVWYAGTAAGVGGTAGATNCAHDAVAHATTRSSTMPAVLKIFLFPLILKTPSV